MEEAVIRRLGQRIDDITGESIDRSLLMEAVIAQKGYLPVLHEMLMHQHYYCSYGERVSVKASNKRSMLILQDILFDKCCEFVYRLWMKEEDDERFKAIDPATLMLLIARGQKLANDSARAASEALKPKPKKLKKKKKTIKNKK